jgi:hypothetical protein
MAKTIEGAYKVEQSKKVCVRQKKVKLLPGDDAQYIAKIGGSLKNGVTNRGLDPEEERMYLPTLIGSDPNKADWSTATENYWKNISVDVPDNEEGLELEVGFKYKTEEDAATAKGGIPINIPNYVLWRYCLVYSKVANSIEDVDKSPNIRFYLFDKAKEQKQKINLTAAKQKAYAKYLEIVGDIETITTILLVMEVGKGVIMSKEDKLIALDSLVSSRPIDFLKVANDKNLQTKALIEKCLTRKFLTIIPNTDTYQRGDEVVAYNKLDLITKLESPEGQALRSILEASLKNLQTK